MLQWRGESWLGKRVAPGRAVLGVWIHGKVVVNRAGFNVACVAVGSVRGVFAERVDPVDVGKTVRPFFGQCEIDNLVTAKRNGGSNRTSSHALKHASAARRGAVWLYKPIGAVEVIAVEVCVEWIRSQYFLKKAVG